jgi:hypothetical protein
MTRFSRFTMRFRRFLQNLRGSRASREEGIAARADMVRCEALAEAAYEAMYEARLHGAKSRYDEARELFQQAVAAAERAGLYAEARRLRRRMAHVTAVYKTQFRTV